MPTWLEVIVRTLIAIVILFLLTKLLGKRQFSQLSFFEYITGITIGSIAATISLETDRNWHLGIIALLVWCTVSFIIEFVQLKSKKARDFLDFKATVLVKDGQIQEANLKKERLTSDELLVQLRSKNVFKIADVEFAILEPNGEINVLVKRESQPLTPKSLGVKVAPEMVAQAVIMDGKLIPEGLDSIKKTPEWLMNELEKQELNVHDVFLGQVDAYGELTVDLYADKAQVQQPQQKPELYALLKKCEADLEMFGLSTTDKDAKKLYEQCSAELQKVIQEIKPLLVT
ncbi:hypothetical protein D3C81_408400 [compost metagenome]